MIFDGDTIINQDVMRYYVNSAGELISSTTGDAPEGGTEVPSSPEYWDQIWLFPGWSESPYRLSRNEDEWRAIEMPMALENVTAIDFGDDTLPGTAAQWKAYWLGLRNWKDGNPDYPDATKRPAKPLN